MAGTAMAQATATTTTTTESPAGVTTTTTGVTTPVPAPAPVPEQPTARDAITGQPVDTNAAADANDDLSLRDKVRAKISEEAQVKQ